MTAYHIPVIDLIQQCRLGPALVRRICGLPSPEDIRKGLFDVLVSSTDPLVESGWIAVDLLALPILELCRPNSLGDILTETIVLAWRHLLIELAAIGPEQMAPHLESRLLERVYASLRALPEMLASLLREFIRRRVIPQIRFFYTILVVETPVTPRTLAAPIQAVPFALPPLSEFVASQDG
ncbi:hypothetical protein GMRT_13236 [Giardia muris]|uniref:Uncharacterized protein n=1 Tax=Giardia muris TaxID=5742 RepID=A0A4Z1SSG5_GIAMU|nr:hypothetical protein GMRT_13236 [Giardia muris]|eukprot:TNJ28710.1 hypothetical protein GMRT_13236 [Giardia muris]